jgi:NAD(P)-dependent dehydrogenase (short-subunit alcohol dehydrogenase family)
MRLEGKVAIITGAASGMGRAAARLFAAEGARVVIADVDVERGEEAAGEIGDAALFVGADVSESGQVQALVRAAVERFGKLTTLYNNAAPVDLVTHEDRSVHELPEHLPRLQVRDPGADPGRRRLGDQHGHGRRGHRTGGLRRLRGGEGRCPLVDPLHGRRLRQVRDQGQRDPARLRAHAGDRGVAGQGAIAPRHRVAAPDPDRRARGCGRFALYLASDESEYVTGGWHFIDGGFSAFKTTVSDYGGLG